MIKKFILSILLIFILTSFTSCWNYREIENLQIVAGVAIDKSSDGKKYILTIETIDFSGGTKNTEIKPLIIDSEGLTVWDAVRNSKKKMVTKPYWGNCQVVILSKDIAKSGILPAIDFFFRDHEDRPTIHLLISREEKASEILKTKSITDPIQALALHEALESNPKALATTNYIRIYDAFNIISNNKQSLALPVVINNKNDKNITCELEGIAIFKKDKLQGFLNSYDTRFILFSTDKIKGGELTESIGTKVAHNATLEIFKSKTKVKFDYKNGKVTMKINTDTTVALTDLETDIDIISESGRKRFMKESETSLENNIKRVIKMVQKNYGVDIFGFGSIISREDPKLWDKISGKWEVLFKDLDIQVTSKINLRNSGILKHPLKIGGK